MRALKKRESKKGLSPVIATVLLIAIALVLVLIIFTWAKTWVKEKIEKNVGGQGSEAIENFCDDIEFTADFEVIGAKLRISVSNIGAIPLYGIEVREKGLGSVKNIGEGYFNSNTGLVKGSGSIVDIDGVTNEAQLIIIPILLGETDSYQKPYTCDEEFAVIAKKIV